jgi:predicted RNA-binding Zn-ribbon protein involved in translation (DUF1610 family)
MNCSNCNAVLAKGTKFCPDCGTKSEVQVEARPKATCPACNAKLSKAAKFCPDCGNGVSKEHTAKPRKAISQNKNLDSPIESHSGNKKLFFSLIAGAAIGLIVYAYTTGGGNSWTPNSNSGQSEAFKLGYSQAAELGAKKLDNKGYAYAYCTTIAENIFITDSQQEFDEYVAGCMDYIIPE